MEMNGVTDSTAEDDVALDWRERLARPRLTAGALPDSLGLAA